MYTVGHWTVTSHNCYDIVCLDIIISTLDLVSRWLALSALSKTMTIVNVVLAVADLGGLKRTPLLQFA